MSLLRIVQPGAVAYDFDYWAMHVSAVLLCLHDHPGLATSPARLLGDPWQAWSLNDFRGAIQPAAFNQMQALIQNWGAQYLLADVLNRDTLGLRSPLLEAISEVAEEPSLPQLPAECLVSGRDSYSGSEFLDRCNARIQGDRRRRVHTSADLVQFTDLCILLETDGPERVAVFGEVEGNHGEYLGQERYWHAKSQLALFGIGLVPQQAYPITLDIVSFSFGRRAVVLLGTRSNVIGDFHHVVDAVGKFLYFGPRDEWWRMLQPGLPDVFAILVQYWSNPVSELLSALRRSLVFEEHVVQVLEQATTPHALTTPQLIQV